MMRFSENRYLKMVLIECTECGKYVSDKAEFYVNCEAPISNLKVSGLRKTMKNNSKTTRNIISFSVGTLFILLASHGSIAKKDEEYERENQKIISELFTDKQPTNLAPISKIISILKTHPWICSKTEASKICEFVKFLSPNYLSIEGEVLFEANSIIIVAHSSEESRVNENGLCIETSKMKDSLKITKISGEKSKKLVRYVLRSFDAIASTGSFMCTLFTYPVFDASSDTFSAKAFDGVDTKLFYREFDNVTFYKSKPAYMSQ